MYSRERGSIYELLDHSLEPRGPDWLIERASEYLIRLVQTYDVAGIGVEPVAIHVERARAAVAAAGLEERIQIVHGTLEECAYPDAYFDFIWSVSTALLRLARLRRQRDAVVASHGEDIYRHVEANLHWEAFELLGKLRSIVYLLRHKDLL